MKRAILLLTLLGAAFISASGVALAVASISIPSAATFADPSSHAPKHPGTKKNTSTNWSGYDITGLTSLASGKPITVKGTWTQQAATCLSSKENSWSSPWVGIDGDGSGTVEQIGTDTDCSSGQPYYYAWYEMYPKSLVQINIPVVPGDSYTATVSTPGTGTYSMQLKDNTTGANFNAPQQSSKKANNASVEWIVEGPSSGLLTDFGTLPFTSVSATINGASYNLSSTLPQGLSLNPITMVDSQGVTTRAVPNKLSGSSFNDTWQHS